MSELDKNSEISNISFDHSGAHIALCHESQGFSANNRPKPLLIKSEDVDITDEAKVDLKKVAEVKVEMSMVDFLVKFMSMWRTDAEALAMLLGYTVETYEESTYEDYIAAQIDGVSLLSKSSDTSLSTASEKDLKELKTFMDTFEKVKQNSASGEDSELNVEKADTSHPTQSPDGITNDKGEMMPEITELEKANKELQDRLVELEKAATEKEDLLKSLIAKEEKEKEDAFMSLVKSFSFVGEDKQADIAKALIEADSQDLVDILEKAQEAIEKSVTVEDGFDSTVKGDVKDKSLAEMIKQKYKKAEV